MEILIIKDKIQPKQKATIEQLIESYNRTNSVWKTAKEFNMCGQTVYERLKRINKIKIKKLTEEEKQKIIEFYKNGFLSGDLNKLVKELKTRNKQVICRFARSIGLTNLKRKSNKEVSEQNRKIIKKYFQEHEHPKGMLGKHHSKETKEHLREESKKMWDKMNEQERSDFIMYQLKCRFKKYGTVATNNRESCSWKAGWREIGGKRKYFRSKWEANYARYLEFLKQHNEIKEWQHESKTFWFENIKRGCRSYLPDFEVTNNDGSIEYHEVKGWFDDRSKTKLKRMQKYYPDVKLIMIFRKQYEEIKNKIAKLIPDWE